MGTRNFAMQLQQLRAAEKQFQQDYTAQAMSSYNFLLDQINASDESEEVKERRRAATARQYKTFMQRDPLIEA